jgi:hypothetical protein
LGAEGTAEIGQGTVPGHLQDQVIALPGAGEVLLGVVDDLVGTDRADHVQALGAAHPGHLGAEGLGQLDREAADPTRRPDDHHRLAWLDPAGVPQGLEGREPRDGQGGGLLEAEVGRLRCQLALGDRGVLGKGSVAPAEDRITRLQLGHVAADGLNAPGHVEAWNRVLWIGQSVPQAGDIWQALDRQPVPFPAGSRVHPDQHPIFVITAVSKWCDGDVSSWHG